MPRPGRAREAVSDPVSDTTRMSKLFVPAVAFAAACQHDYSCIEIPGCLPLTAISIAVTNTAVKRLKNDMFARFSGPSGGRS